MFGLVTFVCHGKGATKAFPDVFYFFGQFRIVDPHHGQCVGEVQVFMIGENPWMKAYLMSQSGVITAWRDLIAAHEFVFAFLALRFHHVLDHSLDEAQKLFDVVFKVFGYFVKGATVTAVFRWLW